MSELFLNWRSVLGLRVWLSETVYEGGLRMQALFGETLVAGFTAYSTSVTSGLNASLGGNRVARHSCTQGVLS